MSIKHLYEDERPSLLLDFANSKTLDPRITFTRNSTATYVDELGVIKTAAAGEARFDHDPVTGESLGLLLEEERTNFATNSTMESSDWQDHTASQSDGTIISSNNAAPDGTNTAVLMGEQLTGNFNKNCYLRQNLTVSSDGDYVISVFAKRSATSVTDTVTVGLSGFTDSNPAGFVRFRMDTLEWSATDTAASYADRLLPVEDYGNGWYRISVKWNLASTGLTGSIRFGIAKSSISGGNGVKINRDDDNWGYFWGAQVEKGSFPTSYIPTTIGGTFTRNDDEAEITGTNLSDWFGSTGGTYVTEFNGIGYSGSIQVYLNFTQGNSRFEFYHTGVVMLYHNIATGYGHNPTYSMPVGQNNKSALSANFVDGSGSFTSNGKSPNVVAPVSSPSGVFNPTIMKFGFALYQNRGYGISGHFKRFAYYNTRLGNTALEVLTE